MNPSKKITQRIIVTVPNPLENESPSKRSKIQFVNDDDLCDNLDFKEEEIKTRKIPLKSNFIDSSNNILNSSEKIIKNVSNSDSLNSPQKHSFQKRKRIVYDNTKINNNENLLSDDEPIAKVKILNENLDETQREILISQLKQKKHPDNLSMIKKNFLIYL